MLNSSDYVQLFVLLAQAEVGGGFQYIDVQGSTAASIFDCFHFWI